MPPAQGGISFFFAGKQGRLLATLHEDTYQITFNDKVLAAYKVGISGGEISVVNSSVRVNGAKDERGNYGRGSSWARGQELSDPR
jgi:hypothetical protein